MDSALVPQKDPPALFHGALNAEGRGQHSPGGFRIGDRSGPEVAPPNRTSIRPVIEDELSGPAFDFAEFQSPARNREIRIDLAKLAQLGGFKASNSIESSG
jgi:hypothetical protein